ncbi:MAG TPA: hypothetical protein VIO35_10315, partial [Chloroflexota bacterium]
SLILADEPTGELDSSTGLQIMGLFRQVVLTQPGVAVIIATHDPTITQIAHITYEISDGVIHQITQLEALPGG